MTVLFRFVFGLVCCLRFGCGCVLFVVRFTLLVVRGVLCVVCCVLLMLQVFVDVVCCVVCSLHVVVVRCLMSFGDSCCIVWFIGVRCWSLLFDVFACCCCLSFVVIDL